MTELEAVPDDRRDAARSALRGAFGDAAHGPLRPVLGGASGALIFRVDAAGRAWLLRLEPPASAVRDPARGIACMAIAAKAGVAPPLHFSDPEAGVSVMDFIEARPLAAFPGGDAALIPALAGLVARLQDAPLFPPLAPYPALVERLLGFVAMGFAPGLLDAHREGFARIRDAYPWNASPAVASHNDPNPRNILFDGERLWLIDWEAAYANDPFVDLAILANDLAPGPDQAAALLAARFGRAPTPVEWARLVLMRALTTLYYGALMLTLTARPGSPPETDLAAMSIAEFTAAVASGEVKPAQPETLRILGRMNLVGFLAFLASPGFDDALAGARG